jgi:hypothetical protein
MNILKLLDKDYKLVIDHEMPVMPYRPDLVIHENEYYHIKETKSIGDNQVHIYVQCSYCMI